MELLQSVIEAYQAEHGGKYWTAFVRINNIGPIKINTRLQFRLKNNLLLGSMSAIGIQGPSNQTFGSHETNFRMDSIVPAIDKLPPDSASGIVWKNGDPKPAGANFFLPIPAGNQSDLASAQPMIDMLKMTMAYGRKPVMGEDFVMRKICDPEELSSFGVRGVHPDVPHLFFTKNWKFGFK